MLTGTGFAGRQARFPLVTVPKAGVCIAVMVAATLGPMRVADAAAVLVSRESDLNGSFLFGSGPNTTVGGDDDSETSLDQRPGLSIAAQDQDNGTVNGEPWSASASISAGHSFVLDEQAGSLFGITSSGSSTATTITTGVAVARADVRNPGNRLGLVFSVSSLTAYELLVTTADSDAQANLGSVQLQRGDGSLWATFVGSSDETAVYGGELRPGLYRIVADARAEAGGASGSGFGSWNYDLSLTAVPVPAAVWLLGSGLIGVLAWTRRKNPGYGSRCGD